MAANPAIRQHQARRERLRAEYRASGTDVRLDKDTSNLFRDRAHAARQLDVRDFRHVLDVDPAAGTVDVEGMTPYADLVDACLARGVMPAVVPELRSITIGGAVSGVGIESSSFRYGLVHATIDALDILTGDGAIVTATPDNEHADLFHGFPNSYGTLGYALRVRARTVPVKPYVQIRHTRFDEPRAFFSALKRACEAGDADFIDGTVFSLDEIYLTQGRFVAEAPWTSDYGYAIYYRSIRTRAEDYLRVRDYIWRWDTDWFWCSKNVFAQNPLVRRLFGRRRLNSVTYQKIMRWNARWGVMAALNRVRGIHTESVIQDVDIPVDRAPEFLDFFDREIGIRPVWICPLREPRRERHFDLYPLDPDVLYVNFGFWDVIRTREEYPDGHFNQKIERKLTELGGLKSLYSNSYYGEEEFWSQFGREAYKRLKARYDPDGRLKDLYRKTVLGE